jgi:hypothetical protein
VEGAHKTQSAPPLVGIDAGRRAAAYRLQRASAAERVSAQDSPSYSSSRRGGKSKTTAVLLAIFLYHWTYVYTYREDGSKFWMAPVVNGINFAIAGAAPGWFLVALPVALGFYIYGIANAANRPDDWYANYNGGGNAAAMRRAA